MVSLWDDQLRKSEYIDLIDNFEKKVKTGKGDSIDVYLLNKEEAKKIINKIFQDEKAKNVIAYPTETVKYFLSQLNGNEFNIILNGNKQEASMADIGISEMEFAISETGTLVEYSYPIWKRLVSSMPSVHIAVLDAYKIVNNFEEAFSIIKGKVTESKYISFITGPSITADIERVLTIGVHGPSKLIVIFLKEY